MKVGGIFQGPFVKIFSAFKNYLSASRQSVNHKIKITVAFALKVLVAANYMKWLELFPKLLIKHELNFLCLLVQIFVLVFQSCITMHVKGKQMHYLPFYYKNIVSK